MSPVKTRIARAIPATGPDDFEEHSPEGADVERMHGPEDHPVAGSVVLAVMPR